MSDPQGAELFWLLLSQCFVWGWEMFLKQWRQLKLEIHENMSILWMMNESSFCFGADLVPFSADTLWNWRITWPRMPRLQTKGWQCFGECAGTSCSVLVHFLSVICTKCCFTLSSWVLNQTQEISSWLYTKINLCLIAVNGDVASRGQGFETLKSDSRRCLSTEPGINHTWTGCGGWQEPWGWGSGCWRCRAPEPFGSGESKGQALAGAQGVLAQVDEQ